jgi:hypothetical protein
MASTAQPLLAPGSSMGRATSASPQCLHGMLRDSLTAAPTLEIHMVTLFVLPYLPEYKTRLSSFSSLLTYFPAYKTHQPIRRTMIFLLEILEKNYMNVF